MQFKISTKTKQDILCRDVVELNNIINRLGTNLHRVAQIQNTGDSSKARINFKLSKQFKQRIDRRAAHLELSSMSKYIKLLLAADMEHNILIKAEEYK